MSFGAHILRVMCQRPKGAGSLTSESQTQTI